MCLVSADAGTATAPGTNAANGPNTAPVTATDTGSAARAVRARSGLAVIAARARVTAVVVALACHHAVPAVVVTEACNHVT